VRFPLSTALIVTMLALLTGAATLAEGVYKVDGQLLTPLNMFRDCDACPEMIVLPLGHFMMGSTPEEAEAAWRRWHVGRGIDPDDPIVRPNTTDFLNETPQHNVVIDIPIATGRNEVTREEWMACVADGHCTDKFDERIHFHLPKSPRQEQPRGPIAAITWFEMQDYVAWLNDKVGAAVYRLPTEAEWEYAARAGTDTPFAQGDTLTRAQANFLVARAQIVDGRYTFTYDATNERRPVTVDELDAANAWGLRHMSGNVGEATMSCTSERQMGLASSSAYLADALHPEDCDLVQKGGYYSLDRELIRPARRVVMSGELWTPSIGFRVVRELKAEP
jgi:formylglycine-generating enzyme required for sulfatase activity